MLSRMGFGRRGGARGSAADIGLALFVVLVVALMIVPLPTWLLDILLALNVSSAIATLLVVLYVPDAIAIATFPTLLLLTTLLRLSLNVATTRLILLQANAGEVIRAFGNFVVRGNYVVGAVVFLILTIIQFVVIAKGAERVAEVGARFVLDAMPGKQMAIDAELRAGSIDGNEAKRRRRQLSRESQFYGAMDGAMKFVKGDVIASLIITVINILGGLAIGVVQRGLEVEAALKRYGLLTIGDGLVTQIPALVLSTAAGVLVTRVASEEADTPLGQELARQLLGVPKALRVAGTFVLLLAIVPGLPAVPFLAIGVGLFVVAHSRSKKIARDQQRAKTEPLPSATREKDDVFVPLVTPWTVEVNEDLAPLLDDGAAKDGTTIDGLRSAVLRLRREFFQELGVPLPPPLVRARAGLGPRQVAIALHELPARALSVPSELDTGAAVALVREAAADVLRSRASDFLGLAEVQRLLDELEQFAPATVRNVVPKPISITTLTDVLRRLVDERISIRDLRGILESLSIIGATDKDPLTITERLRAQMKRAITYRLTGGAPHLEVILLDPILEETIRRAITPTQSGTYLSLAPQTARDVIGCIRPTLAGRSHAVLLTAPDVRRFVRMLLATEFPHATVVSSAELLPQIAIQPVAKAVPTA